MNRKKKKKKRKRKEMIKLFVDDFLLEIAINNKNIVYFFY